VAHDRKLVIGAVALVKVRLRHDIPALKEIRDELESVLVKAGWFPNDHFKWVGLVFRYGRKTEAEPHFEQVTKDHGDLPIALELDAEDLLAIDSDPLRLKGFLNEATLRCLRSVGERYGLPTAPIRKHQTR